MICIDATKIIISFCCGLMRNLVMLAQHFSLQFCEGDGDVVVSNIQ